MERGKIKYFAILVIVFLAAIVVFFCFFSPDKQVESPTDQLNEYMDSASNNNDDKQGQETSDDLLNEGSASSSESENTSEKPSQLRDETDEQTEEPVTQVPEYFGPVSNGSKELQAQKRLEDLLKASSVAAGDPENSGGEIAQLLYEGTKIRVIETDDSACKIKVTYPNAKALLSEISQDPLYNGSLEDILTEMLARLESGNVEVVTETVTTTMLDGTPEINDALLNAYYGGLLSFYEDHIDKGLQSRIDG